MEEWENAVQYVLPLFKWNVETAFNCKQKWGFCLGKSFWNFLTNLFIYSFSFLFFIFLILLSLNSLRSFRDLLKLRSAPFDSRFADFPFCNFLLLRSYLSLFCSLGLLRPYSHSPNPFGSTFISGAPPLSISKDPLLAPLGSCIVVWFARVLLSSHR